MANLKFITANRLTQESRKKQQAARNITFAVGLPIAGVAAVFVHPYAGILLGLVILILAFSHDGDRVIESGAKGEDLALEALAELPDSYTLFNQVDIPNARSRTGVTEADLIVAGPECLFVIEVKHNHGEIQCLETEREWPVVKTGRGGTRYGKSMRNPVKQVKQQTWLLGDYLKKEKARTWVQPLVLFSHPQASLTGTENCSAPIVSREELVAWIKAFRPERGRPVSQKTRQCLVSLKQANTNHQSLLSGAT